MDTKNRSKLLVYGDECIQNKSKLLVCGDECSCMSTYEVKYILKITDFWTVEVRATYHAH